MLRYIVNWFIEHRYTFLSWFFDNHIIILDKKYKDKEDTIREILRANYVYTWFVFSDQDHIIFRVISWDCYKILVALKKEGIIPKKIIEQRRGF